LCRSHVQRGFYEPATAVPSPIVSEALEHIAEHYAIDNDIRGRNADERRAVRQQKAPVEAVNRRCGEPTAIQTAPSISYLPKREPTRAGLFLDGF
jgi:hypothetical protein